MSDDQITFRLHPVLKARNRDRPRRGREVLAARGDELIAAYEAGVTIRALAADAGVGLSTIRRFLAGHGTRLTNDRGKVQGSRYAGGRSP